MIDELKHAISSLESFEYFCQMSSKSILIILGYTVSNLLHFETQCSRPRRLQLEAFTTDSKIIRLISRRVAVFFSTTAARRGATAIATQQIWKFSCGDTPYVHPCGLLGKERKASPLTKSCIRHCTECLFAVFEVSLITSLPSRITPCLAGSGAEPQ